tara:strand:- start:875 stop:1546 length:672 start_codon:yes stop_codon:yes gene_type:complete
MYHITPKSKNSKVGPIAVTTSTATTCPSACPFRDNGCYAESGPLKLHWLKVTKGERGDIWFKFLDKIKELPAGSKWRHNQAGDLPSDNAQDLDSIKCADLARANIGKRGFTYTHYDVLDNFKNAIIVNGMNNLGFTVNVSANNLDHADKLCDLNIAPVATVLPIEQTTNTVTPKGRKVVVCPATYKDNVSCSDCMLCQKRDRKVIVGFPAHGTGKKKASAIAA